MKKLFCLLTMLLVFTFSSQAANNRAFNRTMTGDVNGDNEVNIADVSALIDLLVACETSPAGDINGDGDITIADVNALIDMLLIGYVDPHDTGYWLILLDKNGEPVWYNDFYENSYGDHIAYISLKDPIFGNRWDYYLETGEDLITSLYVMIDGVLYGAENNNQVMILGGSTLDLDNILIPSNNSYAIFVGFDYNVAIARDGDDLYLFAVQAGWASD